MTSDLGARTCVYVIQEFSKDFAAYLQDQEFEPIEVTLDRKEKKKLGAALDHVLGSMEQFFEMCEEYPGMDDLAGDGGGSCQVFGAEGEADQDDGSWDRSLHLPQPLSATAKLDLDEIRAQRKYRCLPVDLELTVLCRELKESQTGESWLDHHGQAMFVSLLPRRALLPSVGPGGRTQRWTAVLVKPGEWKWLELGASGSWHEEVREHGALVVIYRWPEYSETFATSYDLADKEKADVLRCHVNLGHPHPREFVRLLKAAGSRHDVVQYVLREFECPGCVKERRAPTRLPAATPRTYDFNVIVGVDLLFVHGLGRRAEHPVINITCHGTLYSTFGLIDPLQRSSKVTWLGFTRLWLRVFGAPQYLVFDEGREFTASTFQDGLERHGIIPLEVSRQAPFANGVVERRGGMFKEVYYRTKEIVQPKDLDEVETMIFEVSWSLQTLTN